MTKLKALWSLLWTKHFLVITVSKWYSKHPVIGQYQNTVFIDRVVKLLNKIEKYEKNENVSETFDGFHESFRFERD